MVADQQQRLRECARRARQSLGSWTDDRIKPAITQGISADGSPIGFPNYAKVSAADLDALLAYLRSLPPLSAEQGG
jgi:hypothetical protein